MPVLPPPAGPSWGWGLARIAHAPGGGGSRHYLALLARCSASLPGTTEDISHGLGLAGHGQRRRPRRTVLWHFSPTGNGAAEAVPATAKKTLTTAGRGSAGVEAADEVSEVLEAVLCRGRGGTRRRRSGNEEGGLLRMRLPAQPFAVCGPRQKLSALSKLMMAPKPCFESAAINRSVARSSRARISVSAIPKRPAHSSTETVLCDLAIKAALRARNSSAQEMDQRRRQNSKSCNCTNQSLR